jgi:hypothetical protein
MEVESEMQAAYMKGEVATETLKMGRRMLNKTQN